MATTIRDFIQRWSISGGSEQANSQLFLAELCDALALPRPDPAKPVNEENTYSFERKVKLPSPKGQDSTKRLDLYRKGCFVLESKQGQVVADALPGQTTSAAVVRGTRQWEDAMQRARNQAEQYARMLPADEGRPPFLIVADVGHCFDLYTEFTCTGGLYTHYPDPRKNRIMLPDLEKPEVQTLFRDIWLQPLSLDPARRAAKVTEDVANRLAELAGSLEKSGTDPDRVAQFLMRCIFTMFAEDVQLIPQGCFTDILRESMTSPDYYLAAVSELWRVMNTGGYSVGVRSKILQFNGEMFANAEVLPLSPQQLAILHEAAKADWQEVEPAIFGTLLERALDPKERHKLGAHYTPRAYVERLVLPTIMEPLRREWDSVQAAASLSYAQGKPDEARKEIVRFHQRLMDIKVLDPACGSGNFLYVTMEHFKRLEGEILKTLATYGEHQSSLMQVNPHQFLGLEINPRAARIAEMVLWIGYLQWHYRTHGNVNPPEPIIKRFKNIENRDALITYSGTHPAVDKDGNPITHWNGETYKTNPATGRQVPDETAVVQDVVYENVKPAEWPEADYIVGNPPFVGNKRMRMTLGSGYVDAIRSVYCDLPESCDFVMYWWHNAAELVQANNVKRFGFITTNSITQIFNRRIVSRFLDDKDYPMHLAFAIPDHPWVDAADGAAVRIAMTVAGAGKADGKLNTVIAEKETEGREIAVTLKGQSANINADLTVGADVQSAVALLANSDLSCRGVIPVGQGFVISQDEAKTLGFGKINGIEKHIRPYCNGKDVAEKSRHKMVIDLLGLSIEEVQNKYPDIYQWVYTRVKPEREAKAHQTKDYAVFAKKWWLFGKPRETIRPALSGLNRFIVTGQVAKHRFFVFLPKEMLPDDKLIIIATADAYHLCVLSSRIHILWALATGSNLGPTPVYNKTIGFDAFPFPDASEEQKERIRALGEKLDAFRKERQALHPDLTMTGMYNVLEALRAGRELTAKERTIHEHGLVTVLREIHDELDAAVAEAYGWPADLPDEEILARLVALNAQRAAEEQQGTIRYLRPEYQSKTKAERQSAMAFGTADEQTPEQTPKTKAKSQSKKSKAERMPWPVGTLEQTQAVREVIQALHADAEAGTAEEKGSVDADAIAACFVRAPKKRIEEIRSALASLGFI